MFVRIPYSQHYLTFILAVTILLTACNSYSFKKNYTNVNDFIHAPENVTSKAFLKAHHKNGSVYILRNTWKIDTTSNMITGNGSLYDYNRRLLHNGDLSLSIDSISIFETNTKIGNPEAGRIAGISLIAAVDVIIGLVCLADPKTCFGSCPTFYIKEEDNVHFADAEGFSNAIAPSMEYADIDALNNPKLVSDTFTLWMKNEALETHCINEIKLLAFERGENEEILHSPQDHFYRVDKFYEPTNAIAEEGEIDNLISKNDRTERFSLADENNLSTKEEIVLTFNDIDTNVDLGISVTFRQTLMTTYFIYSAIGYMGNEMSDIFAEIENGRNMGNEVKNGLKKELGTIEVYFWDENKNDWIVSGNFYETGPIAFNGQMLPLLKKNKTKEVKVKIVLNKGLWRIDRINLVRIKNKVEPEILYPLIVLDKKGMNTDALEKVKDTDQYLYSMPGDEFRFIFKMPSNKDYQLMLQSKGYYLEWMREHWIKDKNLLELNQMINNPAKYLKQETKLYKQYESSMEELFWNSKVDTKNFSLYED